MKHNRNLDIVRGITILIIVMYHIYAIMNSSGYGPSIYIPILTQLLMYGGEIGVTLFFMISGYGIYSSLKHKETTEGKIQYLPYIKRRFIRIAPQYYISLGVLICITGQAALASTQGIKHIFTHVFFVHNFGVDTHGSINGVLWTMGTIVQFYIISVLLYKLVKKNSLLALVMSIIVTISFKYIFFHIIGTEQYFVYGRQVVTALDNFVIGMVLAKYFNEHENINVKQWSKILLFIGSMAMLSLFIYITGQRWNIYQDSWVGYCWHSLLAVILAVVILSFSRIKFNHESVPVKCVHYISGVQYGIYIWHLVIIQNLLGSSPIIVALAQRSFIITALVLMTISILVGIVSTRCIDGNGLRR